MTPLPAIMVAPTGARHSKSDHPALPISTTEIVQCASDCHLAGAMAIHLHVRDHMGAHVLDAGLYRELLDEISRAVPGIRVQITTEAVGRYSPDDQRRLVQSLEPDFVSISLVEQNPQGQEPAAKKFYHWLHDAGIRVQHILYSPAELAQLLRYLDDGFMPEPDPHVLFVLGRYTVGQLGSVHDLDLFVNQLSPDREMDWAVCAFGARETECLAYARQRGGKARVGFENNFTNADGSLARDNAERVREIARLYGHRGS
jgi:uncharacterized protein (DUF849 family)